MVHQEALGIYVKIPGIYVKIPGFYVKIPGFSRAKQVFSGVFP